MKNSFIKKTPALFAFCLLAFASSSCREDKPCTDNGLPCLTHEGKNTFGCLIDGVPFVASVKFTVGGPVAVSGSFDEDTNYLLIQGKRDVNESGLERINFKSYITEENGSNTFDINSSSYIGFTDYDGPKCEYYHDTLDKGQVTITHLDREKNIISGTFQMTLVNPDCTSDTTIEVTLGRFDFGY